MLYNKQALLLLAVFAVSQGFAPLVSRPTRGVSFRTTLNHQELYASTMEDETATKETMTMEDEFILFGDEEGDEPDIAYPIRHQKKSATGNLLGDRSAPLNEKDHSPNNPLINKLRTMRETVTSCPQLWEELAKHCPSDRALFDEHLCDEKIDLSFSQMNDIVKKSATVFSQLGVKKGVNVAILGENSAQWLIADHGIQTAGGASAVRGADAPIEELKYIYEHSESKNVAVMQGPRLLQRFAKEAESKGETKLGLSNEKYGDVKTIILMHLERKNAREDLQAMAQKWGVEIHLMSDLIKSADPISPQNAGNVGLNDLSTIVYTSGTTGQPKGVMLTHGNLLHQISHRLAPTKQYDESEPLPGETMLSLLPVWHITERTFELWMAARGCNVVYSSIRTFKNDLAKHKPQWLVLVPRVLEKVAKGVQDKFASGSAAVKALSSLFTKTSMMKNKHLKITKGLVVADKPPGPLEKLVSRMIVLALAPLNAVGDKLVWSKVQDGFGGQLKTIISGGSALAGALEDFYETAGLTICVGYGLTECSPLISYRRSDANLVTAGCVGSPCLDTEFRVVDPELKAGNRERPALPDGDAGVVLGRGPQVMKGYFKNPEATAKAVDKFGWFDTGDLGRINPATGDLILTGRCKDTIVLSNGENIEPSPIEDAILSESSMIEQVMLVGQDGRSLTAIAVVSPKELESAGFLSKAEADELQKENEKVNDPKCGELDCVAGCEALNKAADKIRSNGELKNLLIADMKKATKPFRKWEQVSDVYVTLEPFAMANGQLTQSYKVKRDSVAKRYSDEL
mmetsp:Transcript_24090/g.33867  ORF Transcript_24090/g.33867 Transcript_24090/m.33867 type:complete len:800 (+) Transcript_24090:146-2545(+)